MAGAKNAVQDAPQFIFIMNTPSSIALELCLTGRVSDKHLRCPKCLQRLRLGLAAAAEEGGDEEEGDAEEAEEEEAPKDEL